MDKPDFKKKYSELNEKYLGLKRDYNISRWISAIFTTTAVITFGFFYYLYDSMTDNLDLAMGSNDACIEGLKSCESGLELNDLYEKNKGLYEEALSKCTENKTLYRETAQEAQEGWRSCLNGAEECQGTLSECLETGDICQEGWRSCLDENNRYQQGLEDSEMCIHIEKELGFCLETAGSYHGQLEECKDALNMCESK